MGCVPCSDKHKIILEARMKFRMTLKCQKCGERKGDKLGGHFFKNDDEPEQYIVRTVKLVAFANRRFILVKVEF